MLKVTVVDTASEQRLILEGRITALNRTELEAAWRQARQTRGSRTCVIDLKNATSIDSSAEKILLDMKRDGAQFIACGVCTRHQLAQLGIRSK